MEYKTLREFAAEKAVTVRSIQRHIQKHESELKGHIVRYGPPKGTMIDSYAENYLSQFIVGHPVAVQDARLTDELDRLKQELEEAHKMIIALQNERNELTQRALTAESKKELADASMDVLRDKLEQITARAKAAEEITDRLKNRSLWERITRRYEA